MFPTGVPVGSTTLKTVNLSKNTSSRVGLTQHLKALHCLVIGLLTGVGIEDLSDAFCFVINDSISFCFLLIACLIKKSRKIRQVITVTIGAKGRLIWVKKRVTVGIKHTSCQSQVFPSSDTNHMRHHVVGFFITFGAVTTIVISCPLIKTKNLLLCGLLVSKICLTSIDLSTLIFELVVPTNLNDVLHLLTEQLTPGANHNGGHMLSKNHGINLVKARSLKKLLGSNFPDSFQLFSRLRCAGRERLSLTVYSNLDRLVTNKKSIEKGTNRTGTHHCLADSLAIATPSTYGFAFLIKTFCQGRIELLYLSNGLDFCLVCLFEIVTILFVFVKQLRIQLSLAIKDVGNTKVLLLFVVFLLLLNNKLRKGLAKINECFCVLLTKSIIVPAKLRKLIGVLVSSFTCCADPISSSLT